MGARCSRPIGPEGIEPVINAAAAALTEHGTDFSIDASYGWILLPSETQDMAEALRLVDQHMYAQKRSGRRTADRQSHGGLLHVLRERSPDTSVSRTRSAPWPALSRSDAVGKNGR